MKKDTNRRIALVIVIFIIGAGFILLSGSSDNRQSATAGFFSNLWQLIFPGPAGQGAKVYSAGDYTEFIYVDGRKRDYLLHVPTNYDTDKKYPLVIAYHGGLGTGVKAAEISGFSSIADREGFIVAYPDGIRRSWNDGRGTTRAEKMGVDDVNFTKELVAALKQNLSVENRRVYSTGASNGGMMTLRLGCELTTTFAAIAPVIANLPLPLSGTCSPSVPIPIVMINGRDDPLVPYGGGECCGDENSLLGNSGSVISLEDTLLVFSKNNACRRGPTSEFLPQIVGDGTKVEKRIYSACSRNADVVSYLVHGMGHAWPPEEVILPRVTGSGSKNINTSEVIWDFFSKH